MTGRRHVALLAGAVALSGVSLGVSRVAWGDPDYLTPPQQVVEERPRDGLRDIYWEHGQEVPCTPPPDERFGTYICVHLRTGEPSP